MRRGLALVFAVVAAAGVARPAALDRALGGWEGLAAKLAAFR
jgi:hypothetical protein